ncbi:MAG: PilZ domain-containing protein [Terracidiphilus sp.]
MSVENRRSPRFDCRGAAGLQRLPAVGTPISARIENLSEGGCLMELSKPVNLELGEKVELSFEVHHMPFRVLGHARALRSETLIGFQFCEISERGKRQLQDLIEELRPPDG